MNRHVGRRNGETVWTTFRYVALPLARPGTEFVRAEVEGIDLDRRVVRASGQDYPYDIVVIAPGSVTNDFGIPGVREHALAVKWLSDGHAVRHRILSVFEQAARETDAAQRRDLLSFVIVGAGPVGIELASSMRGRDTDILYRAVLVCHANALDRPAEFHFAATYVGR